jgi:hypothetical protein
MNLSSMIQWIPMVIALFLLADGMGDGKEQFMSSLPTWLAAFLYCFTLSLKTMAYFYS